jgi:hypothetical protein
MALFFSYSKKMLSATVTSTFDIDFIDVEITD